MSIQNNNMTGRLYNLIVKLKEDPSNNAYKSLATVFQLDPTDKAAILQSYAELFNIVIEEKRKIRAININNPNKYLTTLDNVIEGLSKIDLNNQLSGMNDFKHYFGDKALIPLEFCAEFLSNYSTENIISDEDINSFLEQVNELISQVLEMNLDKDLKHITIYNLENIRDAIIKYNLFGNKGLMDNIERSLGSLILNQSKVKNETERKFFKNIFNMIGNINMALTLGNESATLIENLTENIKRIGNV